SGRAGGTGSRGSVEDAHLAVEDQRRCFERGDGVRELAKARRMVDVVAADEADDRAVLVGNHSPAVVLLLVHPAWPVERLGERRRHWSDGRQRRHCALLCRNNEAPRANPGALRKESTARRRATRFRTPGGPDVLIAPYQRPRRTINVRIGGCGWIEGRRTFLIAGTAR